MGIFETLFPALDARVAQREPGTTIPSAVLEKALTTAFPLPEDFCWAVSDDEPEYSTNLLRRDPNRPTDIPDELLALKAQVLGDLQAGGSLSARYWARKALGGT